MVRQPILYENQSDQSTCLFASLHLINDYVSAYNATHKSLVAFCQTGVLFDHLGAFFIVLLARCAREFVRGGNDDIRTLDLCCWICAYFLQDFTQIHINFTFRYHLAVAFTAL